MLIKDDTELLKQLVVCAMGEIALLYCPRLKRMFSINLTHDGGMTISDGDDDINATDFIRLLMTYEFIRQKDRKKIID